MGRYWTCETEISSYKEEPTKNMLHKNVTAKIKKKIGNCYNLKVQIKSFPKRYQEIKGQIVRKMK